MRKIRWKPSYQSPDSAAGGAVADLVRRMNGFADEADRRSHCGDLSELHERLRGRIRETVERHEGAGLEARVLAELDHGLPLPARGGPACTECGMCDALEERLRAWAAELQDRRNWRRSA
ncbi:MAG TPA: hypothetical protein VKA64_04195 [Gammaproteobacteria bacterium]|nr:hypothetical protein [Gammaproteobacteria bacterium]